MTPALPGAAALLAALRTPVQLTLPGVEGATFELPEAPDPAVVAEPDLDTVAAIPLPQPAVDEPVEDTALLLMLAPLPQHAAAAAPRSGTDDGAAPIDSAAAPDALSAEAGDAGRNDDRPAAAGEPARTGTNLAGTQRAGAPAAAPQLPPDPATTAVGEALIEALQGGRWRAELQISPEGLGRIDLQLELDGNRAQVLVAAALPETRAMLESGAPRLQGMLAAEGVHLAQLRITELRSGARGAKPESADGPAPDAGAPARRRRSGVVDEFA